MTREWNARLGLDCRTQATFVYKEEHLSDDNLEPVDWKILVVVLQRLCRREYVSTALPVAVGHTHTLIREPDEL